MGLPIDSRGVATPALSTQASSPPLRGFLIDEGRMHSCERPENDIEERSEESAVFTSRRQIEYLPPNNQQLHTLRVASNPLLTSEEHFVNAHLTTIRKDEHSALHYLMEFFRCLPLSDLHTHLYGSFGPNLCLDLAEKYGLSYKYNSNTRSFFFFKLEDENVEFPLEFRFIQETFKAEDLAENTEHHREFFENSSMRGAPKGSVSQASEHFHKSFSGMCSILDNIPFKIVIETYLKEAYEAKKLYEEKMLRIFDKKELRSEALEEFRKQFNDLFSQETRDKKFVSLTKLKELIELLDPWTDEYCQKVIDRFNVCENLESDFLKKHGFKNLSNLNNPVVLRFIADVDRLLDPADFFACMYASMKLTQKDSRFVGVGLSGPEDHRKSDRNFPMQKITISNLKRYMPKVNVTMHAGELDMMKSEDSSRRNRINDCVECGASRLGHAACLSFSNNTAKLYNSLKKKGVCIEICMTSNEYLLGLKNGHHPIIQFSDNGVLFTICSDDEGVNRSPLLMEFVNVAKSYPKFDWKIFKQSIRNSVGCSFLPGKGLFNEQNELLDFCAPLQDLSIDPKDFSSDLQSYLRDNPKAFIQARLEREIMRFETQDILNLNLAYNRAKSSKSEIKV